MFIYLNIHKYDSNTFSWLIPSTILCGANPPPLVPLCPPLSKEPIEYARAVAHPHDTRLGCQPIQPLCFRIKAYGDPNMAKIIGTTQVDSKSKRSVNLSNIHNGSNNYWPKHGSQWMWMDDPCFTKNRRPNLYTFHHASCAIGGWVLTTHWNAPDQRNAPDRHAVTVTGHAMIDLLRCSSQ